MKTNYIKAWLVFIVSMVGLFAIDFIWFNFVTAPNHAGLNDLVFYALWTPFIGLSLQYLWNQVKLCSSSWMRWGVFALHCGVGFLVYMVVSVFYSMEILGEVL
ncbi:MAG: hypothetical protein VX185_12485 [Pseudomonadota bacterium]|nr:hypothetical protein [Pseudomonadota bacterium]